MKLFKILVLILLVSILFDCENSVKIKDDFARISIDIEFPENLQKNNSLQKSANIQVITIIVEASDMDRISEDFDVNNHRVECNLEVPKGDDRLFIVQGKDDNGVKQFSGETRTNITNSSETITMNNLHLIAPDPVNFSFSNVGETEFVINWDNSIAPDFSYYRVLVSTNPNLDLNNDKIGNDVMERNNTVMTITGASPGTVYFAAVVVFDTEGYFSGVLQHGVNESIVKRIETADGSSIPEPVNVQIENITSTSFELFWSKSYAPNFSFYRALLSHNMILNPDDDIIGEDIYDANQTNMIIGELEPNSIYYTAVMAVDNNLEFMGGLEYGQANSIVHQVVTTADQIVLSYDDDSFEQMLFSTAAGTRFINIFAQPAATTYVREVWIYLKDTSGEQDNYRIVIVDADGNDKFYSNPLPTNNGEGWVGWDIPWDNFEEGFVDEEFAVGIECTKASGWPEIGLDQSNSFNASYYVDTDGTWYPVGDMGYPGNLGIRVVVDISGGEGVKTKSQNQLTLTPINSENMKISFDKPGTNLQMINGQDVKKLFVGKKGSVKSRK